MLLIVGSLIVLGSVIGGYAAPGGHLAVLFQPYEFVIILGAALGGFIIANPKDVLKRTGKGLGKMMKGSKYNKKSYVELLSLLYLIFKLSKTKGMLALETHVEKPEESGLFAQFPSVMKDHHVLTFLCDYLRMLTLGTENPHELESLIDQELETHHHEANQVSSALRTLADSMPGLGIVAAVLGVIHTMGSITEPPEVLGHLIGAALVGTFLGILMSYGFVGPMANALQAVDEAEAKYFQCIKIGLLAHLQGYPPAVSVEFARKALLDADRPSFYEIEDAVGALPPV